MADAGFNETEAVLAKIEKRIAETYETAVKESKEKAEKFLRQFEAEDIKKKAQVEAGKLTEDAYKKWRLGKIASGKRYQAMLDTLATDLTNADKIAMSIVNGYMPEVYAINRNFAAFEVEKGSMIDTSFTLYDRQTVEHLIRWQDLQLPKPKVDIPKDKRWNKRHIREQITQGILQGESIPNIAKRLRKVTDMDQAAAIRNARTATTGAQNIGRVDSYKRAEAMGIKLQQEWLATLDGRTRHTHRQLDGEKVKVGDKFPNGCRYPGDPQGPPEEVYNCRCTLVAALDSLDQSDAPRNSKLGGMSYEDWKSEHSKSKFGYKYGKTMDLPIFGDDGVEWHTYKVSKHTDYGFPDGSRGGIYAHRDADVFTLDNGTEIIFPSDMNFEKQSIRPEDVMKSYYGLPEYYRNEIQKKIVICDYPNPQDSYWAKAYKMPGFKSYMVGGENITVWDYRGSHDMDYFTKSLVHEGGHYIDYYVSDNISKSKEWANAVANDLKDTGFDAPSDYARQTAKNNPGYFVEDFADSCAEFVVNRDSFVHRFPNRTDIIKRILKMGG